MRGATFRPSLLPGQRPQNVLIELMLEEMIELQKVTTYIIGDQRLDGAALHDNLGRSQRYRCLLQMTQPAAGIVRDEADDHPFLF